MYDVYIGIDPSINSTGLYIIRNNVHNAYIIKPKPKKLSKKEQIAQDTLQDFDYVLYDKIDLKEYNDNNMLHEHYKTINMITVADIVEQTIQSLLYKKKYNNVYVIEEGISYGSSLRTKSIFDLAGLNYLIRDRFINNPKYNFMITTPSQVKKFASGNGNCKKEVIVELYKSVHPSHEIIPKIDDISDAYFMALYAEYISKNTNK